LKLLPAYDPAQLERELNALIRYRSVASDLRCPNLLAIEHVNRTADGLYYVMPLADGTSASPTDNPEWMPWTLASVIENRKVSPAWFTPEEVRNTMIPLVEAVQRLSEAGVVHRDIKPENILFVGGRPCLGDISLLTNDAASITRRGTPGYTAPSWYLESGGNPDMWGLATTLYTLLTGNPPDKLGRAAFLWPPQGENAVDGEVWNYFHTVIYRATNEQAVERYLRFEDFAASLALPKNVVLEQPALPASKRSPFLIYTLCILVLAGGGYFFWAKNHAGSGVSNRSDAPSAVSSSVRPEFEAALASTNNDFEKAFAEASKRMLGRAGGTPNVERFGALEKKIKEAGSIGSITQALKEIEPLIPTIRAELFVIENKEFSDTIKQLDAIACHPLALAKNAEEGFRGDHFTNPLRNRVYDFQDKADQLRNAHIGKRQDMATLLNTTVSGQASHLKAGGLDLSSNEEWAGTYKLCQRIEEKLTEN
jgi:serine/threonine protein kinase